MHWYATTGNTCGKKKGKVTTEKKNEMPKLLTRAHFRTRKQDALTVIPSALDTP